MVYNADVKNRGKQLCCHPPYFLVASCHPIPKAQLIIFRFQIKSIKARIKANFKEFKKFKSFVSSADKATLLNVKMPECL